MALVQVDQATLDALAAALEEVKGSLDTSSQSIQSAIATLEQEVAAGTLPPASLDAANQALADLQASAQSFSSIQLPAAP